MVVQDVRAQFKENPGIMEGTSKPDYARCVNIVTGAALKEMVVPGVLAVSSPVAVGLLFRHFSASYQANSAIYAAGSCTARASDWRGSGKSGWSRGCGWTADGWDDFRCPAGHADE